MDPIINNSVKPYLNKLSGSESSFISLKSGSYPVKQKDSLSSGDIEAKKAQLRKASDGFEAIFIRQFLKVMRSTLQDGGMFGKGATGEIYSDIMDNSLAEILSGRNTLGISDMLYRKLERRIISDDSSKNPVTEKNS